MHSLVLPAGAANVGCKNTKSDNTERSPTFTPLDLAQNVFFFFGLNLLQNKKKRFWSNLEWGGATVWAGLPGLVSDSPEICLIHSQMSVPG